MRLPWQNKHIPGKHNYEYGKGKITLKSNELEGLIKEHVGTGQRVSGVFGEAGYKERVDFGRIIGEYALEVEGQPTQYFPTTKGIVTHSKNGVHIWPSDPKGVIK